jgi:quercetin dioxygenase-like cupin family protein
MDTQQPTFFADLLAEAAVPRRGILSQTLSKADGIELVLFAFAAGEALAEHTSARPAIIHVLSGEGDLSVAGDSHAARPGTWVRMPPDCRHSIAARTPLVMALYLLPATDSSSAAD